MVYCDHCRRNVSGMRLNKISLCCEHCGKVLEDLYLSQEATFVKDALKDAAGQVDWYIHNEEEKHYNKINWEEMNRQYQSEILLEQAAAKEAFEAKN